MKKSKKERLIELLPEVNALLEKIESNQAIKVASKAQKFNSVVYAPLSMLLKTAKTAELDQKQAWNERVRQSKIVRGAKNLIIAHNDDVLAMFASLSDEIRNNIDAISPNSTLTPKITRIKTAINKAFLHTDTFARGLYESYLTDIFNQGRLHQVVYSPKMPLTKFASNSVQDNTIAYNFQLQCFEEFTKLLQKSSLNLIAESASLVKSGISRFDLSETMELNTIALSTQFSELVREHALDAYAAGNLYQLEKDNTQWVKWQTGQHIDDCGHCRAIQMGDIILEVNGHQLPHKRLDYDRVIYDFPAVLAITKEKGARIFNHSDCRCTFVA